MVVFIYFLFINLFIFTLYLFFLNIRSLVYFLWRQWGRGRAVQEEGYVGHHSSVLRLTLYKTRHMGVARGGFQGYQNTPPELWP